MKISWVTIDRFCQDEAQVDKEIRRMIERNGRPLRSTAEPLSDDELLAKLRDLGVDAGRAEVEKLCEGALSAEEAARPILDRLGLGDDMAADWVWICLLTLWQRWWPDRVHGAPGRQDTGGLCRRHGEERAPVRRDLAGCVV